LGCGRRKYENGTRWSRFHICVANEAMMAVLPPAAVLAGVAHQQQRYESQSRRVLGICLRLKRSGSGADTNGDPLSYSNDAERPAMLFDVLAPAASLDAGPRAIAAGVTAFGVALLLGPPIIRWLRQRK